jgi:hypothetical protein
MPGAGPEFQAESILRTGPAFLKPDCAYRRPRVAIQVVGRAKTRPD